MNNQMFSFCCVVGVTLICLFAEADKTNFRGIETSKRGSQAGCGTVDLRGIVAVNANCVNRTRRAA